MAGVADDHIGAAPPAYGRRRLTMPLPDMETMRGLWCTILRFERCSVRQMTSVTYLQTKVSSNLKLGKPNIFRIQRSSDRHGSKGKDRLICLRWELYHWMQKKERNNFLNHCTI